MRQVCGLDVHKDSVFVSIINENGIVFQDKYGVLTTDLEQMLSVMIQHKVSEVCMESTSIYWMPIWRVLENYIENFMLDYTKSSRSDSLGMPDPGHSMPDQM